jgi:hypothetical protein
MPLNAKRIGEMEDIMNECSRAMGELGEQLDRLEALRDKMSELFAYYGSEDWYEDREAWDAVGEKPEGLTAGVLSEDLVYDGITEVRDLAFRMIESGTDILKNRL